MRKLSGVHIAVAAAALTMGVSAACSLLLDVGELGSSGAGGSASVQTASAGGATGEGGSAGAGGLSAGVEIVEFPPPEGVYYYHIEHPSCVCEGGLVETPCGGAHGVETRIFDQSQMLVGTFPLCELQDNPVRALVEHFPPPAGYEHCWRFTIELRAGFWEFQMWMCSTAGGRLEKLFERNLQTWNILGEQITNTLIDCRPGCGYSPTVLLRPECITDTQGCMTPNAGWDFAGCGGFNDKVGGTFGFGGRMTWVKKLGEEQLPVGEQLVDAYHIYEERRIRDTNDTGTHGTLDPDHPFFPDLGQISHFWLSAESGLLLRYEREIRMSTPAEVLGLYACADYWETGHFQLDSLTPDPLPSAGAGGSGGGSDVGDLSGYPCDPLQGSGGGSSGGGAPFNPCLLP